MEIFDKFSFIHRADADKNIRDRAKPDNKIDY
jgi:hypothetical protein